MRGSWGVVHEVWCAGVVRRRCTRRVAHIKCGAHDVWRTWSVAHMRRRSDAIIEQYIRRLGPVRVSPKVLCVGGCGCVRPAGSTALMLSACNLIAGNEQLDKHLSALIYTLSLSFPPVLSFHNKQVRTLTGFNGLACFCLFNGLACFCLCNIDGVHPSWPVFLRAGG